MTINVCVGSSCHLRGSYKIIELMQKAVIDNNLSAEITLGAAFCLGKCTDGVSVKFDEEIVCGVSPENFNEIFSNYVLKRIEKS